MNKPASRNNTLKPTSGTADGSTHDVFAQKLDRKLLIIQGSSGNTDSLFANLWGGAAVADETCIEIPPGTSLMLTSDTFCPTSKVAIIGTNNDTFFAAQA